MYSYQGGFQKIDKLSATGDKDRTVRCGGVPALSDASCRPEISRLPKPPRRAVRMERSVSVPRISLAASPERTRETTVQVTPGQGCLVPKCTKCTEDLQKVNTGVSPRYVATTRLSQWSPKLKTWLEAFLGPILTSLWRWTLYLPSKLAVKCSVPSRAPS